MAAQRLASLAGWRAFLDAHQSGAYTQSARVEVARLLGVSAATPRSAPSDKQFATTKIGLAGGTLAGYAAALAALFVIERTDQILGFIRLRAAHAKEIWRAQVVQRREERRDIRHAQQAAERALRPAPATPPSRKPPPPKMVVEIGRAHV